MPIQRTDVVVPEEYVSAIIQSAVEQSTVLPLARRVTMASGVEHMPVMSALPAAGWVTGDAGIKPLTVAKWKGLVLRPEELAAIVAVPEAVIDDTNFDIFGEIQPRLAESMAALIDLGVLFGSGAPASFPVGGVVEQARAGGNHLTRGSVTGEDLAGDINAVMGLVEEDGFEVNGFAARVGLKASLRGLRNNQGTPIFIQDLSSAGGDTLYGERITYSRNGGWDNTAADLIAGDWSNVVIGIRRDITIRVLDQATFTDGAGNVVLSLAETDQVALRAYMRVACVIANPVTRLKPTGEDDPATSGRSPFGVLRPVGFTGVGGGPGGGGPGDTADATRTPAAAGRRNGGS